MADAAVDLRDPIFFRWHAYLDDMFQDFKATLPRYTEVQVSKHLFGQPIRGFHFGFVSAW